MSRDPLFRLHNDWLGMVQPSGLFLAPRVLADASAAPTEPITEKQATLADLVVDGALQYPLTFFSQVLGWHEDETFVRDPEVLDALTLRREGGVAVRPDFALYDFDEGGLVVLGTIVPIDVELDAATADPVWTATAHQRLDALLRANKCAVGVLTNRRSVRVVYAPAGELSAHATWQVRDLVTVAGRPLLAALHMCLNSPRLRTLDGDQRLPRLFARSREFQNSVSTRLQGQVLDALQELLDGLQRADRVTDGRLLAPWRATDHDRQAIYHGLVTALLRVVFVLFAEERRLLPLDASIWRESYSLAHLHARLQNDHARLGQGLDGRYGAWAQVVALFRMLHDGLDARGVPGGFCVPPRRGDFFDPDRFAFLEGRAPGPRVRGVPLELPKISDGTVYRVLDRLLVLDGERLKYSDLAVEQIGSVYEGIMGYTLELSEGRALRVRTGSRESGALDVVIDLQRLADLSRDEFAKHLTDTLELKLGDATARALKSAVTEADVAAALAQQKSFKGLTSIERGWMYLQPGQERRRSGSHYTPRSLTEPIVARTLAPLLERLGEHPRPEAILALRVCDPAMGSGAFLVEACRQLAVQLEASWAFHRARPPVPPDEDPLLHARRLVAQRCLYGVDKNRLAVDIARLSLWLETFARDHAFTFLDHCLRHGDSLVGLSLEQIASVALRPHANGQLALVRDTVNKRIAEVRRLRGEIHAAGDGDPPDNESQRALWRNAQEALYEARMVGDLVVAGFFAQKTDRDRERWLRNQHTAVLNWLARADDRRPLYDAVHAILEERGLVPFHWPLEFPEVFAGEGDGFDAFVGNPPFAGKNNLIQGHAAGYLDWLKQLHEESHGNADYVAHFFRRAFNYLLKEGTFGLLATNTIAQGDTRATGLRYICENGGVIYSAARRKKWPGTASVVVSEVHVVRGAWRKPRQLDQREVSTITAFLFHRGGHENPSDLPENCGRSYIGSYVLGKGFTFDDREKKRDCVSSLAEMRALIAKDRRNAERIFPYLGGEELNDDPEQKPHRDVINFGEMGEAEARAWPDLFAIVEAKVKGKRGAHSTAPWWQFERSRPELYRSIQGKARVLVIARVSQTFGFVFLPTGLVYSEKIVVFNDDRDAFFASVQSRIHEAWARFFSTTMKDDLQYTPSDCFETFPFPAGWETSTALDDIGRRYHEHRAAVMKRTVGTKKPEGLTATYNRFHDRNERDREIATLRALHAEMDRAVLDAYGWTDVRPVYDYRVQLDERVRLTWDDDTRDEVLARLLEENRTRAGAITPSARDEAPTDDAAPTVGSAAPTKRTRKKKGDAGGTPGLPGV